MDANENSSSRRKELSLSVEPLLADEPAADCGALAEGVGAQQNRKHRGSRHAKALYTFLLALMALSIGGVLVVHVLPALFTALHTSVSDRFWPKTERQPTPCSKNNQKNDVEEIELTRQFEEFEKNFSRVWASARERQHRFRVFARNVREIGRLNAQAKRQGRRDDVAYGVNELADMTEQEMRQMLLPLDYFKKRRQNAKFIRTMNPALRKAFTARAGGSSEEGDEYPAHLDWRAKGVVTPAKAQGLCGSCWAFAAVATTESAYAVAHGVLRNLSEQTLMDCDLADHACKGGSEDKAFRFIHEVGIVTAEEYPYVAKRQNACLLDDGSKNLTKIDVAVFLNPDEQSMLDWLVNFGPVNVGISVPPDMKPYKSGVYRPSDFDCQFRVIGLHSLLVVGYGQTARGEKYWIAKNSWGAKWGQQDGYLNFARGINACGIEDEPIGVLA